MITKQQYVEYVLSTPKDYPCTYLAEPLEDVRQMGSTMSCGSNT